MQFSTPLLREVKHMLQILNRTGPAYWLAWGALVAVYFFGIAALIKALRWW